MGTVMIDATHLKPHRTAASLLKKGAVPRRIGRSRRRLNSKLHTVYDGEGMPLILLLVGAHSASIGAQPPCCLHCRRLRIDRRQWL